MWGCQRNSVSPDGSWVRSLWLQVGVGDGVEQRVNKVLATGPLLPSWGLSFNTWGHSSRILGSQASVSRGPLIPIWLSLNFGLLPYYIRLLLSYSPFYHGLLSSGSPTVDSTGLVLTPWFQGQEAWCKGPLVTGRAVAWRRLGGVVRVRRQDVSWGRQKGCCRRQGVPSTLWGNAVGVADDDKKEWQLLRRTFWTDYKYTKEATINL